MRGLHGCSVTGMLGHMLSGYGVHIDRSASNSIHRHGSTSLSSNLGHAMIEQSTRGREREGALCVLLPGRDSEPWRQTTSGQTARKHGC